MAKLIRYLAKVFDPNPHKVILTAKQLADAKKAKTIPTALGKLGIERGKRVNVVMKEKLIKHLWMKVDLIPQKKIWSVQRRYVMALADHLAGEALKDSALKHSVPVEKLSAFKSQFFRADNALPQYLEELMMQASVRAIGIFHDKADEMTPVQAGMVAGIFADKALALRKARSSDYKDADVPLATLQKAVSLMEKLADMKKVKLLDIDADIKLLPEKSSE